MGTRSWNSTLFGGTNEYATAGNVHSFNVGDDFSIGGWFLVLDTAATVTLISKGSTGGPGYEMQMDSGGSLRAILRDSLTNEADVSTNLTFNDLRWRFFVMTWEGTAGGNNASDISLYVDGVLQAETINADDLVGSSIVNANDFQISGINGTSRVFNGYADFCFVYSSVLSAGNVTTLYNGGDPGDPRILLPAGCDAFYPMGDLYDTNLNRLTNMIPNGAAGSEGHDFSRSNHTPVTELVSTTDAADSIADAPGGIVTRSMRPNSATERYSIADGVLDRRLRNIGPGIPFTVNFWAKSFAAGASGGLIGKFPNGAPFRGWHCSWSSGTGAILFQLTDDLGATERVLISTTTNDENDGWNMYTFTYDGSIPVTAASCSSYRNGVAEKSVLQDDFPADGTFKNTSDPFQTPGRDGANQINNNHAMTLQQVLVGEVWDATRALTEYNSGTPLHPDVLGNDNIRFFIMPGEDFYEASLTNMEDADINPNPAGGTFSCEIDLPEGGAKYCAGVNRSPSSGCFRPLGTAAEPARFKMRGRDDGRTPGMDYITWIHVGSDPDFAGTGFSGGDPTPIGSLIPGSVVNADELG